MNDDDFQQFALPYLQQIYDSRHVAVRFVHNDAFGPATARHLATMGVNLFNFSFQHSLEEMGAVAGPSVVLLGNIPPRDVLAQATPDDVRRWKAGLLEATRGQTQADDFLRGWNVAPDARREPRRPARIVRVLNLFERTGGDHKATFHTGDRHARDGRHTVPRGGVVRCAGRQRYQSGNGRRR